MIDVALIGGDLIASTFGDIALTNSNNDDIIQSANNNIMTISGENYLHPTIGNMAYNRRLKISDSGFRQIESDSKDAILFGDTRVKEVTYISASNGANYGECNIEYRLKTIEDIILDGRISINIY